MFHIGSYSGPAKKTKNNWYSLYLLFPTFVVSRWRIRSVPLKICIAVYVVVIFGASWNSRNYFIVILFTCLGKLENAVLWRTISIGGSYTLQPKVRYANFLSEKFLLWMDYWHLKKNKSPQLLDIEGIQVFLHCSNMAVIFALLLQEFWCFYAFKIPL